MPVEFRALTVEDLPAPDLGDQAFAYRIIVELVRGDTPVPVMFDALAVRTGRIVAGLTYRDSPVDEADKQLLASTLTLKAVRAEGTLPAP